MLTNKIIYFLSRLLIIASLLSLLFLILGKFVSKKVILDRELQSPFECGFRTYNDFRLKFRIHFFLVALVFIIFDVELIIIFPYFTNLRSVTPLTRVALLTLLLFILTLGLFNEWNQMILEWIK
jgi:NADH:ubiquinone oxidoreductase subunit 3 (subunit A)